MNAISRLGPVICLLLASCGGGAEATRPTATAGGGTAYAIHLTRAEHVGEVVRFRAMQDEANGTKIVMGAQTLRQTATRTTSRLEGTWRVLEVDTNGRGMHYEVTVASSSRDEGTGPVQVLAPGTVVDVRCGVGETKTVFATAQGPLDEATSKFLHATLDMHYGDAEPRDDEMFGSTTPQPVGGSWPIATTRIAEELSREVGTVSDVSGNGTLADVGACGNEQCVHVVVTMRLGTFLPRGMPDGLTVERGNADARFEARLRDGGRVRAYDRQQMLFTVGGTLATPNGNATLTVQGAQDRTIELDPG